MPDYRVCLTKKLLSNDVIVRDVLDFYVSETTDTLQFTREARCVAVFRWSTVDYFYLLDPSNAVCESDSEGDIHTEPTPAEPTKAGPFSSKNPRPTKPAQTRTAD